MNRILLAASLTAMIGAAVPAIAQTGCANVSPGEATRDSSPTSQQRAEYTVLFGVGSSALTPASRATIDRAVTDAKGQFRQEICVIGRASPTGAPQMNQRLATARAQAVRSAMIAGGITASTIAGYVPAAAYNVNDRRAENESDRSVTIIFVR